MFIQKRHLSALLLLTILGCKSNKKAEVQNKPVTKDTAIIKALPAPLQEDNSSVIDTNTVLATFKKISESTKFLKELDAEDASVYDSERPIVIGDLNGDQLDDAIMPFTIEGRGRGNNWAAYYAVFINQNGKLKYKLSFARGGDLSERMIEFNSIENGVIKGAEVPGFKFPEGDSIGVNYTYNNGKLLQNEGK